MAKDGQGNAKRDTKTGRLTQAVEHSRASSSAGRIVTQSREPRSIEAQPKQRAIKYPNPSTALRQHVATVQRDSVPATPIRLRVQPQPKTSQIEPIAERLIERVPAPIERSTTARIRTVSDLGDIIRRERRRLDLSQAELAAKAGTGRRFVSELEGGKPTIEFDRLLKVCKVLGVNIFAEPFDNER